MRAVKELESAKKEKEAAISKLAVIEDEKKVLLEEVEASRASDVDRKERITSLLGEKDELLRQTESLRGTVDALENEKKSLLSQIGAFEEVGTNDAKKIESIQQEKDRLLKEQAKDRILEFAAELQENTLKK